MIIRHKLNPKLKTGEEGNNIFICKREGSIQNENKILIRGGDGTESNNTCKERSNE